MWNDIHTFLTLKLGLVILEKQDTPIDRLVKATPPKYMDPLPVARPVAQRQENRLVTVKYVSQSFHLDWIMMMSSVYYSPAGATDTTAI